MNSPTPPDRLRINVVLPGRGQVWLSELELVQFSEAPHGPRADSTGWSVWFGAIGGSALGVFCGILGMLGGTGKAKRFVLGGMKAAMLFGLLTLAVGIASLLQKQPYEMYYPLTLVGALALLVPAAALPGLRKRYEELELRRMRAMDARG